MTTIEHALFGGYLVLASGVNRRYGWPLVAMAGVVAVLPDWDGLTLLGGVDLCDRAHRCWGHALIVCLPIALVFAALDYRLDFVTRLARLCVRPLHLAVDKSKLVVRSSFTMQGLLAWSLVALIATLSHVFSDMIFSGYADYADWPIKILWPFSDRGFVYPVIPWGDIGVIVIFFLGLFAMLRWPIKTQRIAVLTLAAAFLYIVFRKFV